MLLVYSSPAYCYFRNQSREPKTANQIIANHVVTFIVYHWQPQIIGNFRNGRGATFLHLFSPSNIKIPPKNFIFYCKSKKHRLLLPNMLKTSTEMRFFSQTLTVVSFDIKSLRT